jgi:hypothetical protein
MTPIQVLQKAANLGLKLGSEHCDTLTFQPSWRCPPDFAETLKAHKPYLLVMLNMGGWIMAYSKALGQTVFFCEDEDTKAMLVEAGADEASVYTKAELKPLVEAKRLFKAELKDVGTGSERHRALPVRHARETENNQK